MHNVLCKQAQTYIEYSDVVLDEILDDPAGVVVLPVRLEESRSEHDGQIVKIHLIEIRKPLDAANTHTHTHQEVLT